MKSQRKSQQVIIGALIVFLAAVGTVQAQNLIVNGSFEEPLTTVANGDPNNQPAADVRWNAFPTGQTGLGWIVEWRTDLYNWILGNITPAGQSVQAPLLELQQNGVLAGAMADHGQQWAELDSDWTGPFVAGSPNPPYRGANPGDDYKPDSISIHQHISTLLPGSYELSFSFAARPGAGDSYFGQPQNKLEVQWNGVPLQFMDTGSGLMYPYIIAHPLNGGGVINWTRYTITVQATGLSSELRFTDLGYADSYGTYLDSIIVTKNGNGCTKTVGYWKTHSAYGPAAHEDETWSKLGLLGADTPFFGKNLTWYQILNMAPKGDAYLILAHQYIAAYLNLLSGSSATQNVSYNDLINAMATAESLLSQSMNVPKNLKQQYVSIASFLTDYNEGVIGPGHCFECEVEGETR